jgi:hypothetical protein
MKYLLVSNGLKILADQTVQMQRRVGRIPRGLHSNKPYSKQPVSFYYGSLGRLNSSCNSDILNITVKLVGLVIHTLENTGSSPFRKTGYPDWLASELQDNSRTVATTSNSAPNTSFQAISNLILSNDVCSLI